MLILLFAACQPEPDPTIGLGPDTLQWAPADFTAEQVHTHHRWVDRYTLVGTGTGPRSVDVGATARAYSKLPDAEAVPALAGMLGGQSTNDACRELATHGEAGCRALYAAWTAGTREPTALTKCLRDDHRHPSCVTLLGLTEPALQP